MELTDRKKKILSSVILSYIATGEPVGSKAIAQQLGVSSATVRNEMAELIELNLLEQPHTSAGRTPSQYGYRQFVDTLMERDRIKDEEKNFFDSILAESAYDTNRILKNITKALAEITKYTAITTAPGGRYSVIKAIQFVQTGRRTAMLVLINSIGAMKTRLFHCDFDLNTDILRLLFMVFNERLVGTEVAAITPAFIQSMAASLGEISILASSALMALLEASNETLKTELIVYGQMNLLLHPEYTGEDISAVVNLIENRDDFLDLLTGKPGEAIALIGKECRMPELYETAVLISRYLVSGNDVGAIAVLGPMRMNYARMETMLMYLSNQVGDMLTKIMKDE